MTQQQMWTAYVKENPSCLDEPYEAWCYGSDMPDELAALTLSGVKTATASAYPMYVYESSPLPPVGGHNIILNTQGEAVCITRTTRVTVVPFDQVSAEHAAREGEGDKSLAFWREAHAAIFAMELGEIGQAFSEDMPVVLEEFRVVYPFEAAGPC